MKRIAVIGGDGTGPEVVAEALKCLKAVAGITGFKYQTEEFDWGGERYLRTGEVLPEDAPDTLRKIRRCPAGCDRTSGCETRHS